MRTGGASVDVTSSPVKEASKKQPGAPLKIPVIDCQVMISKFNQQIKENREMKRKRADRLHRINEKKELIARVQRELHRKDSTEVLLEEFEQSLHKADHIDDSPRENKPEMLLQIEDCMDDPYSRKQRIVSSDPVTGQPSAAYVNDGKVDMNILQMCSNIRTE